MGNIAKRTGCKMLLAQKAFSNYDCYHLLEPYLTGTEASGLYEARLGAQEMPGKEVHVFCAGYREDEFEQPARRHSLHRDGLPGCKIRRPFQW